MGEAVGFMASFLQAAFRALSSHLVPAHSSDNPTTRAATYIANYVVTFITLG